MCCGNSILQKGLPFFYLHNAVFVLIKGSGTVMRYFGVDIGLKEGYGQLASAFGMGAMLFRKGSNGFNRAKGSGEGEDRKPEKNFGETLSKKLAKLEELWDMPMNVDYPV
ncbi:hypothetical protein EfmJHP36_05090 [Enterococcus faecium]|nr:hypothetical protein EfmJHP36_05090 [Enterococcus faecium]